MAVDPTTARVAAGYLVGVAKEFEMNPTPETEEKLFAATANNAREAFKLFEELKERHDTRNQ